MNIYQMYVANGNKAGFYVVRDSWGNTIAEITTVGGKKEGMLPGKPPYYGNPPVKADIYKKDTGSKINTNATISCPGTYAYTLVEDPFKK